MDNEEEFDDSVERCSNCKKPLSEATDYCYYGTRDSNYDFCSRNCLIEFLS